ncbi:MAG: hypothetical protein WB439_02790 [Acidobacteriaceae bacterium]
MRCPIAFSVLVFCAFGCVTHAQLTVRHVSEPAGKTLEKAFHRSTLGQPGAKPFHVRLEVSQAKGKPGDYAATIEETWAAPDRWIRTVHAHDVSQVTVMNGSGLHVVTQGEYFPKWLRDFVTGLFAPVPDPNRWDLSKAPIEYIELPNGTRSNPCQHAEFNLGEPPLEQVNFANDCFRASDGLLEMAQSPNYTIEFNDYASFGKLKIARELSEEPANRVELAGRVTVLEEAKGVAEQTFDTPAGATDANPLESVILSTPELLSLAGGLPDLIWPNPIPGHGMFTAWVSIDRDGMVREAHSLNSDESGIAAEMTAELVGRRWKPYLKNGVPTQSEGALVFEYPPRPE